MAQQPQRLPCLPDSRLLAFALAVVRSKPIHLSIPEYLDSLRKHVVPRPRQEETVPQHLDIIRLWTSRYEQSQRDLKAARAETESLRLQLEELGAEGIPSNKSRKRTGARASSPVKTSRRSSPNKPGPTTLEVLEGLDIRPSNTAGMSVQGKEALLLRHLFNVHTIFDHQVKLDPQELAYHLVSGTQAVVDVVREAVQYAQAMKHTANVLETNLLGLTRVAAYLFVAIARLSKASRGHETEGKVVYAFVDMFAQILAIMSDAAKGTQRTSPGQKAPERRSARLTGAEKCKASESVPSLLTRFLCTIIGRLDLKIAVHRNVFDGISFSVIQRAGDTLYTLVFGHRRRDTLEEEMAHSATLPSVNAEGRISLEGGTDYQASILDAPHLIQLVKYISRATDAWKGLESSNRLAATAKERMQRTLINCTFGTEGLPDDHPFLDCLKSSFLPVEPTPAPEPKGTSLADWYTQELWEWIGWDILQAELSPDDLLQTSMSI